MIRKSSVVAVASVLAMCAVVHADPISFGFEDQLPSPTRLDTGRLSHLTLSRVDFSLDISRPGSLFDLCDNALVARHDSFYVKPREFGDVSLSTFFDVSSAPIIIDFSEPISSFGIDAGDYAEDIDTLDVEAFSGLGATGTSVARTTDILENNHDEKFGYKHLQVQGDGIRSVRILCGSPIAPHSMFYDNLTVELPTPTS